MLSKTGGPRHYTLWLPSNEPDVLERVVGAFGPVEPNPLYQRQLNR